MKITLSGAVLSVRYYYVRVCLIIYSVVCSLWVLAHLVVILSIYCLGLLVRWCMLCCQRLCCCFIVPPSSFATALLVIFTFLLNAAKSNNAIFPHRSQKTKIHPDIIKHRNCFCGLVNNVLCRPFSQCMVQRALLRPKEHLKCVIGRAAQVGLYRKSYLQPLQNEILCTDPQLA